MKGTTPPSETAAQQFVPGHALTVRYSPTPRGARLARRMVTHQLDEWGHPSASPANEAITLITAELASNAVRHGRVPGRDFELRLAVSPATIRVEVSDTLSERLPTPTPQPPCDAPCGRGLVIVAHLATRWGITARRGAPGKSVWAEVDLTTHGEDSAPGPWHARPVRGIASGTGPGRK